MSTPGTSDDSIKMWLKVGDIEKLEEAVINGYGDQLRNKTSRIPKINHFLKQVPHFQTKIDAIHEAVAQGKLREVQSLLDRKKLAMCRSQTGASPLHTAILNNQTNIAKYILEKFPTSIQARDNQGRTALHYAAVATDDGELYRILLENGADKKATDMRGKIPEYYLQNPEELPLKSLREGAAVSKVTRRNDRRNDRARTTELSMLSAPSKIEVRMLIQKADLNKLEAIVLNGYGDRLLGETSVNSRVKEFLDQVPEFMIKVANLHAAAVEGSLREMRNLLDRRTLAIAKDPYGANVLHRSVVHNHHNIVKYLVNNYPETINSIDFDGRTPLHYSVAVEDERIYKTLIGAGADESIKDNARKTAEYYQNNPLDIRQVVERGKFLASKTNENPSSFFTILSPKQSSKRNSFQNGPLTVFNIRQWVRNGEVDKLEQLVLEGHGIRLVGESAADARTRAFLKQMSVFLNKIESLHEAVVQGNLRQVKVLLDRKQFIKSKFQGLGLLHKSLLYNHSHITSYICQSFPDALVVKDSDGRMPLHYAAVIKDDGFAYHTLREAGADPLAVDGKGNTAIYYRDHPEELDLLEMQNRVNRMRSRMQAIKNSSTSYRRRYGGGLHVTRANIRKWIHAEDLEKLNQVVFEGQGTKLLVETSSSSKVKEFLKTVPSLITKIKEVHQAAQEGNLAELQQKADSKQLFLSKDIAGITPLHRAVIMGHRDISKYIVQECPDSIKAKDYEGRTPLHYAAALPKDDNVIYNMLLEAGGDDQQLDEKGNSPEYYQQHPSEADLRTTISRLNRKLPQLQISHTVLKRRRQPPNTLRLTKNPNKTLKDKTMAFNSLSPEHVTKLINQGDVEKLEQLVLEGYGKKLYGKTSWIEELRHFLRKVPAYMDRIYAVHKATVKGDLRQVEELMDNKKLVVAKDEKGLTPLHRAVKYGKSDIVKYMLQMNPAAVNVKDKEGRTPLHYAGMYRDRDDIYKVLENVGADPTIADSKNKTPQDYRESNMKLEMMTPQRPEDKDDNEEIPKDEPSAEELEEDKNISEWIASDDLENLEKLIMDGKGDLLLGKSSDNDGTKEFLECVPAVMGKIRAIHTTTVEGDLRGLQSLIDKRQYATARDSFGACPLHLAILHGHTEIVRYLANNFPATLSIQDNDGRTALHYAAVADDGGLLYRLLHKHGADPNVKDKNGRTPGHFLRGKAEPLSFDDLSKRYEEKKVPPRPPSVQTWQRPPTAEILRALTPDDEEMDLSPAALTESQTQDDLLLESTSGLDDTTNDLSAADMEMTPEAVEVEGEATAKVEEPEGQENRADGEGEDNAADEAASAAITAAATPNPPEGEEEPNEETNETEQEPEQGEPQDETDAQPAKEPEEPMIETDVEAAAEEEATEDNREETNAEDDSKSTGEELKKQEVPDSSSEPAAAGVEEQAPEAADESTVAEGDEQAAENEGTDEPPVAKGDEHAAETETTDEPPVAESDEHAAETEATDEPPVAEGDEQAAETEATDEPPVAEGDELAAETEATGGAEGDREATEKETPEAVAESDEQAAETEKTPVPESENAEHVTEVTEPTTESATEPTETTTESATDTKEATDDTADTSNETKENVDKSKDSTSEVDETKEAEKKASATDTVEETNESTNEAAPIEEDSKSNITTHETAPLEEDSKSNTTTHETETNDKQDEDIQSVTTQAETKKDAISEAGLNETSEIKDEPESAPVETENTAGVQTIDENNDNNNEHKDVNPSEEGGNEQSTQNNDNTKSTTTPSNGLRSSHLSRNHSRLSTTSENPMWSKEGEYLASAMGDALIKALTEVSHRRPKDPIGFLAVWLYLHEMRTMEKPSTPSLDTEVDDDDPLMSSTNLEREELRKGLYEARLARSSSHRSSSSGTTESPADDVNVIGRIKDENGKTILHFAAGMRHEGNALWHLLLYAKRSPAEKDINYQTARDIAEEAELNENVSDIDKFVGTLIVNNKLELVKELMLNCYEHILDVDDPVNGGNILSAVQNQGHTDMLNLLKGITLFQEQVKELHSSIICGDLTKVQELINEDLAIAKNPFARCSLHIAVLYEQMQIIEFLAKNFPMTLRTRDNMWRTPLHYAMGVENSQEIAKILVKCGASRQSRDVRFRSPSYYFVEPQEIANLVSEICLQQTPITQE